MIFLLYIQAEGFAIIMGLVLLAVIVYTIIKLKKQVKGKKYPKDIERSEEKGKKKNEV